MKISTHFLFVICILFFINTAKSQSFYFTQYYASGSIVAPSFAGFNEQHKAGINNRSCPELSGMSTFTFTYTFFSPKINSGFGLNILRDEIADGLLTDTRFEFLYAYKFRLAEKWYCRPGINVNFTSRYLDFYSIVFSDQLSVDSETTTTTMSDLPDENKGFLDATSSILVYSGKYKFGLAVDNLFKHEQTSGDETTKVSREYKVFGDVTFNIGKDPGKEKLTNFTAFWHFRSYSSTNQFDWGLLWNLPLISFGVGTRGIPFGKSSYAGSDPFESVLILTHFTYRGIELGYSYDMAISDYVNYHEFSLMFNFGLSVSRGNDEE